MCLKSQLLLRLKQKDNKFEASLGNRASNPITNTKLIQVARPGQNSSTNG